jgi:hypothetical protein
MVGNSCGHACQITASEALDYLRSSQQSAWPCCGPQSLCLTTPILGWLFLSAHRGWLNSRSLSFEYSSVDCHREDSEHYPSCNGSDYASPHMGAGEACRERDPKCKHWMAREEHHFVRQQQSRKGRRGQGDENMPPKWTIHDQPDKGKENAETGVLSEVFQ